MRLFNTFLLIVACSTFILLYSEIHQNSDKNVSPTVVNSHIRKTNLMDTFLEFDTASWDGMVRIAIDNSQHKKYSIGQDDFDELYDASSEYGLAHLPGLLVLNPIDGSRSYHIQISLEEKDNFAIDPTFRGHVIPLKLEENSRLVFLDMDGLNKDEIFEVNAGQYAVIFESRPLTIEELERWDYGDFPPELIDPDGYHIPKLIRIRLYKTDRVVEPVYDRL